MNPKPILIADDIQDHRIILRHQLQRIGTFDVLEAIDGQEALDVNARSSRPHHSESEDACPGRLGGGPPYPGAAEPGPRHTYYRVYCICRSKR
jgi:hypothetical protein